MSSVSDQLQRNVGRSCHTAVKGDKEMCGEANERKGDRQRGGKKQEREKEGGGIIRDGGKGEMTPQCETLRNFVSCSRREAVSSCRPRSYATLRASLLAQTHCSQIPSSAAHLTVNLQCGALLGLEF